MGLLSEWRAWRRFQSLPAAARQIVFYAETRADWIYFEPIIAELTGVHKRSIAYLTSDPSDPILRAPPPRIAAWCIGSGTICTLLFRSLAAQVMVITLTDLDTYHLKRSAAHPVHYVYVFHSIVSSHMVFRPRAYDAYDTILCVGPHHMREIRRNEELNGLKPKRLIEHGYGRLDAILADALTQPPNASAAARRLLIAPSWGPDCITATCAPQLIAALLAAGYDVTLRPHPMSLRQDRPALDALHRTFASDPRFTLELDIRSAASLQAADIMISDWSGVALEFAFGLERPVLFIDTPRKINNPHYQQLDCEPIEVAIRAEIGSVLSPARLAEVPDKVNEIYAQRADYVHKIRQARQRSIYNVGSSGKVGAQAILDVLAETAHA